MRIMCMASALFLAVSISAFPSFFDNLTDLDARGKAMAGAVSAMPRDGNIIGINPAGIPFIKNPVISLLANPQYITPDDRSVLSSVMLSGLVSFNPYGGIGLAATWQPLFMNGTLVLNVFQATLGYGIKILPNFSFGVGGRFSMWTLNASELGAGYQGLSPNANAGVFFTVSEHWSMALSANNILGPFFSSSSGKDTSDAGKDFGMTSLRYGLGFRNQNTGFVDLDVVYSLNDWAHFDLGSLAILLGGEIYPVKYLALRVGFQFSDLIQIQYILQNINISGGVGLRLGDIILDVSYANSPTGLTTMGSFALSVSYVFPMQLKGESDDITGPTTGTTEVIPSGETNQ
ncbi:MAG: hypothetical protein AABZ39_21015 [Spirochaetota bacterium]